MCCFKNKDDDFIIINFHVHLQVYKLHAFLIKLFRALLILSTGRTFATNFLSWSH